MKLQMILLLGTLGAQAVQAASSCSNTEKGRPVFIGSQMLCSVHEVLDADTAPDLSQKTLGAVKKIEIDTELNFRARPAENIGSTDFNLKFSPIQARGKIYMSNNGEPLDITINMAPEIKVAGSTICALEVQSIKLGVSSVEANVPTFVRTILKNYLNQNLANQKKIREGLLGGLEAIKAGSCDSQPATAPGTGIVEDARWAAVEQKRVDYLSYGQSKLDSHSWIWDTHCDALLMTSLYNIGGGHADLGAMEHLDQPGRPDRHWMQDCYNTQPNAEGRYSNSSTISRDMMMGFSLFSLLKGDPALIQRIISYGEQHAFEGFPLIWILGEGDLGRVDMPPASVSRLYTIREKLAGIPSPYPGANFEVFSPCRGFECHLEVLSILFDYKAKGYVSQSAQNYLQALADRQPRNALFNIAFGKIAKSQPHIDRGLATLLDESLFPSDRLPNSNDRCDSYIFSREMFSADGEVSHDWQPCPDRAFEEYAGVDLIFTATVLKDF